MTQFNRLSFAAGKQADSAESTWWANAVAYQIYPRSFQDSNGDGMGDLRGITSRLPYLADLGVDVVWLSPVYKSPQDDNGYDISDYQDIDPMFGTLADMDALLAKAHELGIKVIMDLVVNHTSDEHAWFQASKQSRDNDYSDWCIWEDPREGFTGGEPGAEPNNWGSYFGGSAWGWAPERGQYYFHQFSKKQPDLNWENPNMRAAVFTMMNWWMNRGVDGFRMDVISLISKRRDENGKLHGVNGSLLPEQAAGPDGFSSPALDSSDGPRLDEFLKEMHTAVFDGREGYLTVGEAPGISYERAAFITNPQNRELDMLFLFEHMEGDIKSHGPAGKWGRGVSVFTQTRPSFAKYESIIQEGGWTSLFLSNHDQPRSLSRWGDDSSEEARVKSAKALALLLHMHKGTPYIYQGEELGMTNADYTSLDQYQDLETLNLYKQITEAGIMTEDAMMDAIKRVSRDNARTPMQWDDSVYAGFEAADAEKKPWLGVNANKSVINAAAQFSDSQSVYAFYKRLIDLRHTNETVALGDWNVLDADSKDVYAFTRTLGSETLLVFANTSRTEDVEIPAQTAELLEGAAGVTADNVLISNESIESLSEQLRAGVLKPWTAAVVKVK